eukprot:CAMPEP_0206529748 /NCGR_PEP_ID=MMETSP0325_2-20121206/2772_1 /ASSEMBLY_ACC=CAM_ASM_000347 /TAXON_ID=2866 /ORGANISM="Crypthecodinium cohnii, Strain Seligo" /LENGTH=580 /DNA_ID=CAMNT_0054025695 /DNA_START=90 /DNA_END=1832 /DNA_ORIENTATION=+
MAAVLSGHARVEELERGQRTPTEEERGENISRDASTSSSDQPQWEDIEENPKKSARDMSPSIFQRMSYHTKGIVALLSILILVVCLNTELDPTRPEATKGLAVLLIVGLWWLTEALPLTVTSLFPIVLYPFLGLASPKVLAKEFFKGTSFLFIGGFFVGLAIERWGLHKRVICAVVCNCGSRVDLLVGGFIASVWMLSAWISNTATAVCMMPVVQSFLDQLPPGHHSFKAAVLLAVGWAASIGGLATPVGTPTNGIMLGQFSTFWPDFGEFPFAQFVLYAAPISVFMVWVGFCFVFVWTSKEKVEVNTEVFKQMRDELGPITFEEAIVGLDLLLLTGLWFTAAPIAAYPGWKQFVAPLVDSGSIGLLVTLPLFVMPCASELPESFQQWVGKERCHSKSLLGNNPKHILDWDGIRLRFQWEILFVFGGGAMLAYGTVSTGLAGWLAEQMSKAAVGEFVFILMVTTVVTFVTEVVSNMSTMSIFGSIVATAAQIKGFDPVKMMLVVCFSSSFSFMMPTATGPNMVVYGTGLITVKQMAKMGLALNIAAIVVASIYTCYVLPCFMGSTFASLPAPGHGGGSSN